MKKGALLKPLLPLVLASCATTGINQGHAPTALTPEFNRQAVADAYNSACAVRDYIRASHIQRPGSNTPREFRNGANIHQVAIFSPELTPAERRTAERLVESLPDYVMDLVYKQGVVFVFTSKSLVEAMPDEANYKDARGDYPYWNMYVGLYRGDDKRIFVTFNIATLQKQKDGKTVITGYTPVYGSKERVINHEVGHFIDDLLGELGENNPISLMTDKRFTDTDHYLAAVQADMDRLAANPPSEYELRRIDYFMPEKYKGVKLFGDKDGWRAARKEVFAELWAEAEGYNPVGLAKYFPETFKLVKALNQELREIYKTNGQQCAANRNTVLFKLNFKNFNAA